MAMSRFQITSVGTGASIIAADKPRVAEFKSITSTDGSVVLTHTAKTIDLSTSGAPAAPDVVNVTSTTKTLALSDANTLQNCSNASAQTITLPANATVAFPTNTSIVFMQAGAGTVTVTGAVGVTVNGTSGGSFATSGQYTGFYIIKTATNTWDAIVGASGITALTGDVTATGPGSAAATVASIGGQAVTLGGTFTTSGAFNTTLTTTATTNITLPTSGTVLASNFANAYAATVSTSPLQFTGAILTGGSATTNFPSVFFNQGATPLNSLSTSGTYFGVNAAAGFAGDFINFQINNGGAAFKVTSGGNITNTGTIAATGAISGTNITGTGTVSAGTSSSFLFTSSSRITAPSNGVVLMQNNGQTAIATLECGRPVSNKTSDYPIVFTDSNTVFTNAAAGGTVIFTLPTAAVGMTYTFYVAAAQTLEVLAGASTTIRVAGSVSGTAGNITNATIGGAITLVAVTTTSWVALSHEGTWTVT